MFLIKSKLYLNKPFSTLFSIWHSLSCYIRSCSIIYVLLFLRLFVFPRPFTSCFISDDVWLPSLCPVYAVCVFPLLLCHIFFFWFVFQPLLLSITCQFGNLCSWIHVPTCVWLKLSNLFLSDVCLVGLGTSLCLVVSFRVVSLDWSQWRINSQLGFRDDELHASSYVWLLDRTQINTYILASYF